MKRIYNRENKELLLGDFIDTVILIIFALNLLSVICILGCCFQGLCQFRMAVISIIKITIPLGILVDILNRIGNCQKEEFNDD